MKKSKNGILTPEEKGEYIRTGKLPKRRKPRRDTRLLGPDGQPVKMIDVQSIEVESPFDDTPLDWLPMLLKEHGIALSKIMFMVATGSATVFGGLAAANAGGAFNLTVALMVWGCGLLLEIAFAYAWFMEGSEKLAGEQKEILRRIFNTATWVMLGDLGCMLLEHQFAGNGMVHNLFIFWTSVVQTGAAIYIMRAYFNLKGAHPIAAARDEAVTTKAEIAALWIKEDAAKQRLMIDSAKNDREINYRDLEIRIKEEKSVVNSRKYRKKLKKEASRKLLGDELIPIAHGKEADEIRSAMGKIKRMISRSRN